MPPRPTPPDERIVLELSRVRKRFAAGVPGCCAQVRALDGVSWRVRAGELAVVEGGAGAGKTTLLLCAAGLLRLDGGSVRVPHGSASASVRHVTRLPLLLDADRARDDSRSRVHARAPSGRATRALDEIEQICGLSTRIREARAARTTHVAPLARVAYAADPMPSVLLLDLEDGPAGELAPALAGIVARLRRHGLAIVLATRQASALGVVADNVLTLRCGRVERARRAAVRRRRAPASGGPRRKPVGDVRR